LKEGQGLLTLSTTGEQFDGTWQADKRQGLVTYINLRGERRMGQWENDVRTKWMQPDFTLD
jgi:hypothetical protein